MKPLTLLLGILMLHAAVRADEWKPAKAPLMTRWAKDVSPQNSHPEYPRPQMVRKDWLNLNGLWQFASSDQVKEVPIGKDLPDQILVPFCMESALSGVMKHADRCWYRRTFEVPQDWAGKRVLLHFGAVDYEAKVWVNGKEIGSHKGGYDAFSFDITDALKRDDPQELVVGVVDTTAETQARGKQTTKPEGIFYVPCSGIWQTVWLEPVPRKSIRSLTIEPDSVTGTVIVQVTQDGLPAGQLEDEVELRVYDRDKMVRGMIARGGGAVTVQGARQWSPSDPYLYDLKIALKDAETGTIDEVSSYFGFRKIEVARVGDSKQPRILLNGKPIMQVGPLDQGYWPDGNYTAPTDDALKYDIEITKKLGFNMIRKHVKVEPQRFYYWCDKLGLLVWQDMPSAFKLDSDESKKQFEAEMKSMIEQHRNSPSIVCWVPFNEGWGQDNYYDKAATKRVSDWVKKLDPTRLVNNASGWTDSGAGDMHDIHVYPGPSAPKNEETRAIVLGEFGGLGLGVDGHTWSAKTWGYREMEDRAQLTDRYVRLLGRLWQLHEDVGLDAGVYTQTTDVETECNGFLTYDRAILKMDPERVRQANLGKGPRVELRSIVACAADSSDPPNWKYTFEKPSGDWTKPDYDDSSWKTGPAGFGTEGTPGARVHTKWNTPDIWIRRSFDLKEIPKGDVHLNLHHDEEAQIYINGVEAAKVKQFTTDYIERAPRDEAVKSLRAGRNTLAAHCHQTGGGQYIDVGIVQIVVRTSP